MEQILDQLIRDCNAYRTAVDRILSTEVVNPIDWQNCLFNAQICAVWLQLDRLIVIQKAAIMETLPKRSASQMLPRSHAERQMRLREQTKDRLVTSADWGHFKGIQGRRRERYRVLWTVPEEGTRLRIHPTLEERCEPIETETGERRIRRNHAFYGLQ